MSKQDKILGHKDVEDNGGGIRLVRKGARGDLPIYEAGVSISIITQDGTRACVQSVVPILVVSRQINVQVGSIRGRVRDTYAAMNFTGV